MKPEEINVEDVKEEILETYEDLIKFFIGLGEMQDESAAQDEITEPVGVPS